MPPTAHRWCCCTADCSTSISSSAPSSPTSRRAGESIAVDFQGHGRTNDIDRPFSAAAFAGDVLGVLDHLGVGRADIFGFSVGGAVALELAIEHPERVRKVIVSSTSFAASGMRGSENADAVGAMTVDMIAGTPMEAAYLAKSPHPDLGTPARSAGQARRDLRGRVSRSDGRRDPRDRGADAHHGGRRRHGLARACRRVPAPARGRRERRLRRGPRIPARGLSGHDALLRAGPDGPGPRCGHRLPGRRAPYVATRGGPGRLPAIGSDRDRRVRVEADGQA